MVFFGRNCTFKCRYPTFGEECQSVCDCDIRNCNHVNGCIQPTKSKIPQKLSIICSIVEVHLILILPNYITSKKDQF